MTSRCSYSGRPPRGVSIRAPARGATPESCARAIQHLFLAAFQSAPPRGGRRGRPSATHQPVSMLACSCSTSDVLDRFNPRPREGGDVMALLTVARGRFNVAARWFQSAPPRGGRPQEVSIRAPGRRCCRPDGNPRPREGGDLRVRRQIVSIRAPARGATIDEFHPHQIQGKFQSAPPRGGRRLGSRSIPVGVGCVSIRAPARGATYRHEPTRRRHHVSIRAPARGATRT